jgi:tetratricopeptide (TPR) repeat protein
MGLTKELVAVVAAVGALAMAVRAAPSAELFDVAGRIDYGFYNADARAIETAVTVLDRLGESPETLYYRDLAGLRLAQLGATGRIPEGLLTACAQRTVPSEAKGPIAAEAWVLAAACAVEADSLRRAEQALARARALDADNPRIALVAAWAVERARDEVADAAARAGTWEAVVAAFDSWNAPADAPQWGRAEALAEFGEIVLASGDARAARDLIERALLEAPDYARAVELRGKLVGGAGRSR